MTVSLFLTVIAISALLVFSGLQVMYFVRKLKMHTRESLLIQAGGHPSGSGVSHGMVLNEAKNGVVRDSKKSPSWYNRLISL